MRSAEQLAAMMSADGKPNPIQVRQTRFRISLVDDWHIPKGARVLEIGCGQGDTTEVLAEAVGPTGSVLAVDLADPSYGAPSTLGESSSRLLAGPLGSNIEFRFNFDVLSQNFSEDEFDFIVMAHCTWYFKDLETLRRTLQHIRPWAQRLCLSEWDLEPRALNQVAHLLAVIVQGQVETFKADSRANVRTPYSLLTLRELLTETGWNVESFATMDASEMDDGRWEVDQCLRSSLKEAEELDLSPKSLEWVRSLTETLTSLSESGETAALPASSIVARRR